MLKMRKVTPIVAATLLVAGFIVIHLIVSRRNQPPIPNFGQKPPSPPAQNVPFGGFNSIAEPQTESTPAHSPWLDQELELYPEPVYVTNPTEEELKGGVAPGKPFGDMVDGLPRQFDYRELFSLTSPDRKFWPIVYTHDKSTDAYNANVIPHPSKTDHWVVVAQRAHGDRFVWPFVELTCAATFTDGTLRCVGDAVPMPVVRSIQGACPGKLFRLNNGGGPRDARVFYGRSAPYVIYNSQATRACFSLWIHDISFASLEFTNNRSVPGSWFRNTMEIQRPPPFAQIEKNYFVFWDNSGVMYAHYNTWPKRSFAQLNFDGSAAGPDLASAAEQHDQACMAKLLPSQPLANGQESIHQATNSLQVTMCRRSDPTCTPTDANTFVMAIYHQTAYYRFHGVYEPFVWLFKRSSPFEIHAISQKPFWIHGRNNLTAASNTWRYRGDPNNIPSGHTEMFYVTSINWRNVGQYDHGYLDDVVHIAFGIEDTRSGVLDVSALDLLQDLKYCDLG